MPAPTVIADPSRTASKAPSQHDRLPDSRPPRARRRIGPTPPSGPGSVRRLPAGSAGGTVTHRPNLDGAQRPREWDRMAFRPALGKVDGRTTTDSEVDAPRSAATAPQTTPAMPDPARFATVVVTAAAEVLSGQRRADNLARWTTPELFAALARRAGLARRLLGQAPTRPRPRSVHAQQPKHGTCEVTILLDDGNRVRAAAARLEAFRGRWLLAALEIA